jgi:CxxC-x17-CxxC domain-containing protein
MKNFNNIFSHEKRNGAHEGDFRNKDHGRKRFGGSDDGGRRDRTEMFEGTCSDCGRKCMLPFKPTGDKPVYCRECFSKQRGGDERRTERRDFNRPRFQDKRMFDAVCDKCGKRFELPFKPTGDKPVYCNDCFDKGGSKVNTGSCNGQCKEQFDALNLKLDTILKLLTSTDSVKNETAPKAKGKISVKKASKKVLEKKKGKK